MAGDQYDLIAMLRQARVLTSAAHKKEPLLSAATRAKVANAAGRLLHAFLAAESNYRSSWGLGGEKLPTEVSPSLAQSPRLTDDETGPTSDADRCR